MLWQRGRAYSQDLRDRVFAAADAGTPVGQIADMLLVSGSYVSKVLIRRCQTGETAARPQCCHVPAKLKCQIFPEWFQTYVAPMSVQHKKVSTVERRTTGHRSHREHLHAGPLVAEIDPALKKPEASPATLG
jgi:hypothetical protein